MARDSYPEKPAGISRGSFFRLKVWEFLFGGKLPIVGEGGVTIKWDSASRIYIIKAAPQGSVGKSVSFKWQSPKELDPSIDVPKDTLVYISSGNDLVTTGLPDLVSSVLTFSKPGIWQAAQDVPAASDGSYNVPQFPYPGATGIPSGSPLKGDLDGENVFWIFISPEPCS